MNLEMHGSSTIFGARGIAQVSIVFVGSMLALGCGSSSGEAQGGDTVPPVITDPPADTVDISNAIFEKTTADCTEYVEAYSASVLDITRGLGFDSGIEITADNAQCVLSSNNIPNHDFNDNTANFRNQVAEIDRVFSIPGSPALAVTNTPLAQQSWDAVMLNGVVLDLLSAGCYRPSDPSADANGNVAIGCNVNDAWLMDPLGTEGRFGTDQHNAHTQPDGTYHYHGDPNAMFDDNPGPDGSPVVGFASDGFPIYGSYFADINSGLVRAANSGYQLKQGTRPSSATDPGGAYDGTYIDDYEFTGIGDLDVCNGMTVNGQYAYYITDDYPWVLGCHSGTPDNSFRKN
jgi:hypothetical protein